MSFDPNQPSNPYATPSGGSYMAPNPGAGTDVSLILGIIAIVFGIIALPMSCCACFGIFPGGLAVILGVVALFVPSQPGSVGKMLGIGGIVMGLVPFVVTAISLIVAAANPH